MQKFPMAGPPGAPGKDGLPGTGPPVNSIGGALTFPTKAAMLRVRIMFLHVTHTSVPIAYTAYIQVLLHTVTKFE